MKYYAGIDLGGTNIAVGIVDENYNMLATNSMPTLRHRPFEEIVADMALATREAADNAGISVDEFESVGIGAPSSVHPKTKNFTYSSNLGWRNVPIVAEFRKHIDKPVYTANDADCAALGEAMAGVAKDYENVMLVTLGTGVGGGIIMNGKIYTGADGASCELGHTTLVLDGVSCTCGRKGCFESYASVTALIRQTKEMMAVYPDSIMCEACDYDIRKVSGRTSFEAAKRGDIAAKKVVDNYIYYVGNGISSLINAFRPSAVIIGGGISNEGEYLLDPMREVICNSLYGKGIVALPTILKAALGNAAGIIGAALLETQENL